MATPALTLKAYDTYPPLTVTLSDENGPIDLTEADSVLVVLKGQVSADIITGSCTVADDPTTGVVSYAWADEDTETPDLYDCEWQITWTGGIQKIPNAAAENPTVEIDASLNEGTG